MGFSGIRVLAVGLAYCGFRRFRRSKLGFTQADRERMDQRFDQVEKQVVRMGDHTADVHGVHQSAFRADAEHDGPALCRTA